MHLTAEEGVKLATRVNGAVGRQSGVDVVIAPTFTALGEVNKCLRWSHIRLTAQNMNEHDSGAYTGEVSSSMLLTSGCVAVILGHSERRTFFSESAQLIGRKVTKAIESGLTPIICVGETVSERENSQTEKILTAQLSGALTTLDPQNLPNPDSVERSLVIAYEPIWAVGTGKVATPEIAQTVHAFIRNWLADRVGKDFARRVRILYGGSVRPENAAGLLSLPDIDGALVGGASLSADDFLGIIAHAPGYIPTGAPSAGAAE